MSLMQQNFSRGAAAERKQLLFLALGLLAIGSFLYFHHHGGIVPVVILSLGAVALLGTALFSSIGRDIYLCFALFSLLMSGIVSKIVVGGVYALGILFFGSLLKLSKMDQLQKDFARCKSKSTMLDDSPLTDIQSFGRQS